MRGRSASLSAASLALIASTFQTGCKSTDADTGTTVVVDVWSDLSVPEVIDLVEVDVDGTVKAFRPTGGGDLRLVATMAVIPRSASDASFTVVARGLIGGSVVVSQRATVMFESGNRQRLVLGLMLQCQHHEVCAQDSTCEVGSCVSLATVGVRSAYDETDEVQPKGVDAGVGGMGGGEGGAAGMSVTGGTNGATGGAGGSNTGGTGMATGGSGGTSGVLLPPPGAMRCASKVFAGDTGACILTDLDALVCWGNNVNRNLDWRQPGIPMEPVVVEKNRVFKVALGGNHTCYSSLENNQVLLRCFGSDQAAIGNGTTSLRPLETPFVHAATNYNGVIAGLAHTCVSDSNLDVYCWGNNSFKQVSESVSPQIAMPTRLNEDPFNPISLVAGSTHNCISHGSGDLYCWGNNNTQQIGDKALLGNTVSKPTFISAVASPVQTVSSGVRANHTCARSGNPGRLLCWGSNEYRQVSGTSNLPSVAVPTEVSLPVAITSLMKIATGASHTCALANSRVFCWGSNQFGQIDGSLPDDVIKSPIELTSLGKDVRDIAIGQHFTCAVREDKSVWCWGYNQQGESTGQASFARMKSPVAIVGKCF